MNESLADVVRAELNRRRGTWPEIAIANDVSYSWIAKLAAGSIPDPGVRKIERLHHYLFSSPVSGQEAA